MGGVAMGAGGQGTTEPIPEPLYEYAAFKIEQRGIDLIPDAERKMKPSGLFWLWAGCGPARCSTWSSSSTGI
jgi:hypothetical protein